MTRTRGFSLIELMVVLFIILLIAAIAVPNIMTGIARLKVNSLAGDMDGALQQCRMQAVKNNRYCRFYLPADNQFTGINVAVIREPYVIWADPNETAPPNYQNGDPMLQWAPPMAFAPAGAPVLPPALLVAAGAPPVPLTNKDISFNPRGLPCDPSVVPCATGKFFVYYFSAPGTFGVQYYAAVTVTPSGRMRAWSYDGANWN